MISVYNVETREDLLELRNSSISEVTWEMLEMESETIFTSDDELRIACWQSLETKKTFVKYTKVNFLHKVFFCTVSWKNIFQQTQRDALGTNHYVLPYSNTEVKISFRILNIFSIIRCIFNSFIRRLKNINDYDQSCKPRG